METLSQGTSSETEALRNLLAEKERENARLREDVAYLEEVVRLLRHQKFGAKSEQNRHPGEQLLFNEAEQDAIEEFQEGQKEDSGPGKDPSKPRGKPSRKPLPARIPRVEKIIDLPENEKFCPLTGRPLHRIGEEVTEQLDIVPATVQVLRIIRPKYACSCGECTPKSMHLPPQPIPKSMASPGLLAFIATSKYADALPLYRQESILQRIGCDIPRSTLASWMIRCGELVTPLINLMRDKQMEKPLVFCDESPVQVLKGTGKKPTSKCFMWVTATSGEDGRKIVLYEFAPTRGSDVPLKLFQGYKGYVQTDGYEGYAQLGLVPGITLVGDWVHARRKFIDAVKGKKAGIQESYAQYAIEAIKKLYMIEAECTGQDPGFRFQLRQTRSRMVIDELRSWLDKALHKVPPKSLTGQALAYLDGQWPKLIRFLTDPVIGLDTNVVENAIRPLALGRKNWLFSDTVKGANASAALYSLVITARANGIEPYDYLAHIFSEIPKATSLGDLECLLPWNFATRH